MWTNPKTNWQAGDLIGSADFNRIEGNIEALDNTYNIGGTFLFDTNQFAWQPGLDNLVLGRRVVYIPYSTAKIVLLSVDTISRQLIRTGYGSVNTDVGDDLIQKHRIRIMASGKAEDGFEDDWDEEWVYPLSGISSEFWDISNAPIISNFYMDWLPFGTQVIIQHEYPFSPITTGGISGEISANVEVRVLEV